MDNTAPRVVGDGNYILWAWNVECCEAQDGRHLSSRSPSRLVVTLIFTVSYYLFPLYHFTGVSSQFEINLTVRTPFVNIRCNSSYGPYGRKYSFRLYSQTKPISHNPSLLIHEDAHGWCTWVTSLAVLVSQMSLSAPGLDLCVAKYSFIMVCLLKV